MAVLLVPFLLLELFLSLKVGEMIGFAWSVIWIIGSFMLGLSLLKKSQQTMMVNMNSMMKGKIDMRKFQNVGMAYFIGSILLMIPGVFSDFLGVIALCYTFYLQFIAKITPESTNNNFKKQGDDDVIDVEIID